jgi:hypothetical protein
MAILKYQRVYYSCDPKIKEGRRKTLKPISRYEGYTHLELVVCPIPFATYKYIHIIYIYIYAIIYI